MHLLAEYLDEVLYFLLQELFKGLFKIVSKAIDVFEITNTSFLSFNLLLFILYIGILTGKSLYSDFDQNYFSNVVFDANFKYIKIVV